MEYDLAYIERMKAQAKDLDAEARKAFDQQEYTRSRQLFQQALETCRLASWKEEIVYGLLHVAQVMSFEPDYDLANARPLLEEALQVAQQIGTDRYILPVQINIIRVLMDEGNFVESFHLIQDALPRAANVPEEPFVNNLLTFSVKALSVLGLAEDALRLFGSTEAERDRMGAIIPEPMRSRLENSLAPARAVLSQERQAMVEAEGYRFSLDDAVHYALSIVIPE
jgi:hypothetical protein